MSSIEQFNNSNIWLQTEFSSHQRFKVPQYSTAITHTKPWSDEQIKGGQDHSLVTVYCGLVRG